MNYDKLYKVEKFITGEGDEVRITAETGTPGGSAANTIYGLAKLGLTTGFIGALGDDPEGKTILNDFKSTGVDISKIAIKSALRTSVVHGFVDRQGERALYINPGANSALKWEDIDIEYALNSQMILFTSFVDNAQLESQIKLVENIVELGVSGTAPKIIFSPGALYSKPGKKKVSTIIENSHICFLNQDEIRLLTGMEYQEGARELIGNGVDIITVTLGKAGAYITDGENEHHIEGLSLEPNELVDTTGAGDAFATGFIYGLYKGEPMERCGRLGNFIAAHCIRKMGAREGLPIMQELNEV